jgi:hypothetical protein
VEVSAEAASKTTLLDDLADLLELPKELFALRVKECFLRFELGQTDKQIRQLASVKS